MIRKKPKVIPLYNRCNYEGEITALHIMPQTTLHSLATWNQDGARSVIFDSLLFLRAGCFLALASVLLKRDWKPVDVNML